MKRTGSFRHVFDRPLGDICISCQRSLQRRNYASAATAIAESASSQPEPTPSHIEPPDSHAAAGPKPAYQIRAGVVLSRPPVITRDLHPFEKAFYLYQRRLNERLALPFTRYFYYKQGTPGDIEWKRKIKERTTPARDIGIYNAYSKEGWNDELLVGAQESEPRHQREALLKDAELPSATKASEDSTLTPEEQAASKVTEIERPAERITDADRKNDTTSLSRLLQRTLYLVVKDEHGDWRFPSAELEHREPLRPAAERVLAATGGRNINTWVVGNHPVGHYAVEFSQPRVVGDTAVTVQLGEKTFFMKGRVMAGQVDMRTNTMGHKEFKWLAKEEIKSYVSPKYWEQIENMLAQL